MTLTLDERTVREVLKIRRCDECGTDVMMLDSGICPWCDSQLETPQPEAKRTIGRPRSLPTPPAHIPGFCDFCGGALPKHKSKFCKQGCRQAYWVRFTAKGRAWVARQNDRKQAA